MSEDPGASPPANSGLSFRISGPARESSVPDPKFPGPESIEFPRRTISYHAAFFVKPNVGPNSKHGQTAGKGWPATPCWAAIGARSGVGFLRKTQFGKR